MSRNATSLEQCAVGRRGLTVSALGFGGAPLGDLYAKLDEGVARATVAAALDAGITYFDTAPLYGHGLSEHRLGSVLRGVQRDSIVISTKVGRWMDPRGPGGDFSGYAGGLPHRAIIDYSFDGALRSIEQSLLRLGTDRIDILLIHDVDAWTHGPDAVEQRFGEAMNGAYRALARLREEGVVKAIGVGVNDAGICVRFAREGDFDVMMVAGRYTLLEQPALETFLPLAEERRIAVLLAGVFNSGILATGAVPGARYNYGPASPEILDRVARIEKVCRAHGVALSHAAMVFPLGHSAIASIVLGAVSPEEVRRNAAAFATPIPPALWSDLKDERLLAREAQTP
jgi:D-threo-aldose 1-dehydrogenase